MGENPYKRQIEMVLAGLKKGIPFTEPGRQTISFALVLASQWGAGDAVAGSILNDWGIAAIGKVSLIAGNLKINVTDGGFATPAGWWTMNLVNLADGFLNKDVAEKLKAGASSGRGILGEA